MKTVTTNNEQKLFVIPCEGGYSCLGFEVLEKRANALEAELKAEFLDFQSPVPAALGTLERYAAYQEMVNFAFRKNVCSGWRSKSELTPELIGLEGKWVEVRHQWESGKIETSRFIVGKSAGYIPCHLEIESRKRIWGGAVCLGKILNVKVI